MCHQARACACAISTYVCNLSVALWLVAVLKLFVYSAGNGGGVVLADDNATWTLANISLSNFIDNPVSTGDGGSLSVTGGITLLDRNTFLRSNAAARGGAVMYVQTCINIGSLVGE